MQPVVKVALAVGAFLLLATVISFVMHRRKPDSPGVTNLYERTLAWWGIAAVFGFCLYAGPLGVCLLYALLSFQALREFAVSCAVTTSERGAWAWVFFVALPVQYALSYFQLYGLFSIMIPVFGFILLSTRSAAAYGHSGDLKGYFARAASLFWGCMLCVYCLSHASALLFLPVPGATGPGLLFFLILTTQLSDVLQYVFGKLFGRAKLAPNLSPGKTRVGLIGGILSTSALSLWYGSVLLPFALWQIFLLALVVTFGGFFGGMVMSAVKRDRNIKDWGTVIRGHGGVLDRVDSIMFSAPMFFHLLRYFFV